MNKKIILIIILLLISINYATQFVTKEITADENSIHFELVPAMSAAVKITAESEGAALTVKTHPNAVAKFNGESHKGGIDNYKDLSGGANRSNTGNGTATGSEI